MPEDRLAELRGRRAATEDAARPDVVGPPRRGRAGRRAGTSPTSSTRAADQPVVSALDTRAFALWARLSGRVPRIAVVAGRCFAGNAVLAGCSDLIVVRRVRPVEVLLLLLQPAVRHRFTVPESNRWA